MRWNSHYCQYLCVFVGILALALGYVVGDFMASLSQPCSPHIRSGTIVGVLPGSQPDLNVNNPIVSKCREICAATKSAGVPFTGGLCLDDDLNGYACAVVVNDSGHCPSYSKGAPEIVLNAECGYIGVYRYSGDANAAR